MFRLGNWYWFGNWLHIISFKAIGNERYLLLLNYLLISNNNSTLLVVYLKLKRILFGNDLLIFRYNPWIATLKGSKHLFYFQLFMWAML